MSANFASASHNIDSLKNGRQPRLPNDSVAAAIKSLRAIDGCLLEITQPEKNCDPDARREIQRLVEQRAKTLKDLVSVPQILADEVAPFLEVLIDSLQFGEHISCEKRCDEDVFYAGLDRVRAAIDQHCPRTSDLSELRWSMAKYIKMQEFYCCPDHYCSDLIMHRIAIPQAETVDERRVTKVVGVSAGWCRLLGFRPDEILGKQKGIYERLTDESRARAFDLFPIYLENGCYHNVPFDIVAKCGKVVSFQSSGIAQRNSAGEIVAGVSIYTPCE